MENDAKSVTMRELRQEEATVARDIVVDGLYRQTVTIRAAFEVLRAVIQGRLDPQPLWVMCVVLFFFMAISYAFSNSVLVSVLVPVVLTVASSLPVIWGLIYVEFGKYVHKERMELEHLYSWYNAKPGSRFWVAVCGGKIIGTAALERTSDTTAELRRMSVLPEYRRRGVATRLMGSFQEFCKSDGVKKMFLTTSLLQPEAVLLYQKCGFVITETTPKAVIRLEKLI
ncbi:hypothetical protein Bbelb_078480 [Branchiostoma belcheri]|nr:hypothetical protein Bbelb_078480 [Branchiostoma belcheri]